MIFNAAAPYRMRGVVRDCRCRGATSLWSSVHGKTSPLAFDECHLG